MRRYPYVGDESVREFVEGCPEGEVIDDLRILRCWLEAADDDREPGGNVTFVVDLLGRLRLAPRRSEHVACAGGGEVLAAGEIAFEVGAHGRVDVVTLTNQSTGYCPDESCFAAVAQALDRLAGDGELHRPESFTEAFVFRRCEACGERNLVKEGWFVCDLCGADLPDAWNFV